LSLEIAAKTWRLTSYYDVAPLRVPHATAICINRNCAMQSMLGIGMYGFVYSVSLGDLA
jgi:hypothetical protein